MCWFVIVGCTPENTADLERAFAAASLTTRPSTNPSVAALFPSTDTRLEVTHGGCSCDLWTNRREQNAADLERRRRSYLKKGWSEGKIARALEAADRVQEGRVLSSDETRFRELLVEQARRMGSLRLLAHFYSGSQDEETLAAAGEGVRRCIPADELLRSALPADVLLEVVR